MGHVVWQEPPDDRAAPERGALGGDAKDGRRRRRQAADAVVEHEADERPRSARHVPLHQVARTEGERGTESAGAGQGADRTVHLGDATAGEVTTAREKVRLVVAILLLAGTAYVGARRIGPAPALGAFLDPAHGVWSLARSATMPRSAAAEVHQLGADVTVLYDDRAVPHIFASSELDAYRALGYVTARDRLFQLYLQTMAASGRLTEIAGPRALALDREMRGLGLPRSAERLAAGAQDTSEAVRRMRAYADGINAYIAQMPASELPLEFRLIGATPSPWTLVDSYHLFNR